MSIQQVLVDLGEGYCLSIIQGEGVMGSRPRGTVEVALVTQDGAGNVVLVSDEPMGHLDAKDLATYIQTYQQDRYYRGMFDEG